MPHHSSDVPVITDAADGLSADSDRRHRRYMWTMLFRTVCFILLIVTPSPWRWMFLVFAVALPTVAVVLGNNADHRTKSRPGPPAAESGGSAAGELTSHTIVKGEVDDAA